jgi:hypothetical protein
MTDYRNVPLGPYAPDRIGEIVECPHCHEHGLKVDDFKDAASGSIEKETIYIHFEDARLRLVEGESGKTVEEYETITNACRVKTKPTVSQTLLEETPPE